MTKKLLPILGVASFAIVSAPLMTSCGKKKGEAVDTTRTQIYVNNFNRGFGGEWLTNYKKAFEKLHENDSYETGKKGVQVMIDSSTATADTRVDKILLDDYEVYFTEQTDYFTLLTGDGGNPVIGDITDAVTSTIPGETKSIEDKMSEAQKNYLKINDGQGQGHYYAIPHYSGYFGLTYDVDLFDEAKLYLDASGTDFVVTLEEERYVGPDGVKGTSDDGLPATYEQFYMLCEFMLDNGITPLVGSGANAGGYMDLLVNQLATQNMGAEQMQLVFSCNGVAKNLATVDASGAVVEMSNTTVTPQNGYVTYHARGKYDGIKFFERCYKGDQEKTPSERKPYFLKTLDTTTDSAYASHVNYLGSRISGATSLDQPIAMIAEGNWWVNEASSIFDLHSQKYGTDYSMKNRSLAFMPLPKATLGEDKSNTVYDHLAAICFTKKGIPEWKKPLINQFLQFVNSDESLVSFTVTTNTMKALNYEIPEEQLAKMNYFGRSMYEVQKNATIVYPFNNTEFFQKNVNTFKTTMQYKSKIGTNKSYSTVYAALSAGNTAEETFKGIYTYFEEDWTNRHF